MSERIKNQFTQNGLKVIIEKTVHKVQGKQGRNVNDSSKEKRERFESFHRQYLYRSAIFHTIPIYDDIEYDIYVVGSDVIWKPDRVQPAASDVYFLNFAEAHQCGRIAYAASIGTDDVEMLKAVESKMGELIQKFDSVSVREKTSVPFVQKLWRKPVTWCIDPTMFLERCNYDRILKGRFGGNTKRTIYIPLFV